MKNNKDKLILIVECDDILARTEKILFEKLGYRAEVVTTGEECLEFLSIEKPDLILLEVKLPEMDGLEVLSEIAKKESLSKIPVIILTGSSQEEKKQKARELGARAYIIKSDLSIKEIAKKVKEFI